MMKLIRHTVFFIIILITGCSSYNKTAYQYATGDFKQLKPQYVTTQNGRIEYYRFGHGTPVVFIPGYATDVSSWNREFLATIALHHQIIVPNNRDVGGTQIASKAYQSRDLAKDTYQLIQKLNLKKPTVVGISMGGMIAQKLAVSHPECIGHLVLINTAIAGKQAVMPKPAVKQKLLNLPPNKVGFYVTAIDLFFPPSWKMPMAYSLIIDRFQPNNLSEINPSTVLVKQQKLILDWFNDDETAHGLARLQVPVLVLNGEADEVIPPVNSEILAATIPHARLERWHDGGHAMIYQHPEELGNKINGFIQRVS